MSTPPTDSRQPPDGHEFPDFIEDTDISNNYFKETKREPTFTTFTAEYKHPQAAKLVEDSPTNTTNLTQVGSASNTDLRAKLYDSSENVSSDDSIPDPVYLHRRSQSLINMSTLSKEKNAKWNQLIEQRKRGISKLKGLVIPEASESDVPAVNSSVNIPEIKSHTASLVQVPKETNCASSPQKVFTDNTDLGDPLKYSILTPPWSADSPSNIPKYSPAFKRKSLQVYPKMVTNETYEFVPEYCDKSSPNPCPRKQSDEDINPPKSLESISSPTRSDCSFDYTCFQKKTGDKNGDSTQKSIKEDESDNDSAVSSSQFSYNSRFSPPPSPTKSCEDSFLKRSDDDDSNGPNRLLKPFSIEAINRKNILASAKCRSGKDFKIGSPVIKRKTEEAETGSVEGTTETPPDKPPDDEPTETEPVELVETVDTAEAIEAVESIEQPIEPVEKEVKIATETEKVIDIQKPVEVKLLQNKVKEVKQVEPKTPVVENAKISYSRPISRSSLDLRSPNVVNDDRKNRFAKDLYGSSSILNRNHKPINVKVLMENFENFGSAPPPMPHKVPNYKLPVVKKSIRAEVSTIEHDTPSSPQTSSDIKKAKSVENIKPSEVKAKKLFERGLVDKVEKFERASCQDTNVITMVLTLDSLESNLGVALTGGADEHKEITVHRIRYGSVAYSDGRLKKGDKILAINGKSTKGLTLAEATELLKEKTKKFVFQVREGIESVPSSGLSRRSSSVSSIYSLPEATGPHVEAITKKPTNVISFLKDDSGFGFSIEGGKDPFKGDMPLIVKKIFTGGAADKNGELKVGDEIIYINDVNVSHQSKMEAWNAMKKIPNGVVNIHVYR
ncbi:unnamed protein product [Acanthoscelides obtectus]|nr:unnamed protein product [Acanthoscelides obtectus]CAK1629006.1 Pro-interleukin-16 [Acanthoscelides obtectus]